MKNWDSYPEWKKNSIRTFNRSKVIVLHDWKYNIIYAYLSIKYNINKALGKEVKYYCNYCKCVACKYGWHDYWSNHAPTADGKWICNTCYHYDVCTSGPNRSLNGPCEDENRRSIPCKHRPVLIGDFQ